MLVVVCLDSGVECLGGVRMLGYWGIWAVVNVVSGRCWDVYVVLGCLSGVGISKW